MRNHDDGAASRTQVRYAIEALLLERGVTDSEHFVDQQDVRFGVNCNRKRQPHLHATAVGSHWSVDGVMKFCKVQNSFEPISDLCSREAPNHSTDEYVLPPCQVGMKARCELEQTADAPANADPAFVRATDTRQQAQQRRLSRTVASDDAQSAPALDGKGDVAKTPESCAAR